MKKLISILGSTGSIGLSTLKIIDKKKDYFKPYIFSANKNIKLINQQIKKYKPEYFVINDQRVFNIIKEKYKKKNIVILNKFNLVKFKKKVDITVTAIPGLNGLMPTLFAIKNSKKILLANKESVICGWDLIKKKGLKFKTKIVPIDSEHYSILKLIENVNFKSIRKIYLTASGGPFLNYKISKLKKIKPRDAIKHPKWKMGKKISVDSSTLMNKMLELIEAQKLFNIPSEKLDIVIHPNSLVHAIIELNNGLIKFIYHETSMVIPIANAIFDGSLDIQNFLNKKNSFDQKKLIFQRVDKKKFPIIMIKNLLNKFPSSPVIINASNEILVDQFLMGKIPFLGISKIIMSVLKDRNYKKNAIKRAKNLNQIIKLDKWAKEITYTKIKKFYD